MRRSPNKDYSEHYRDAEREDPHEYPKNDVEVRLVFSGKAITRLYVIVEAYDHKKYGRGKREYLKTFTERERRTISKYYTKLYRWYFVTGVPRSGVVMKGKTYDLLCRTANFFASI